MSSNAVSYVREHDKNIKAIQRRLVFLNMEAAGQEYPYPDDVVPRGDVMPRVRERKDPLRFISVYIAGTSHKLRDSLPRNGVWHCNACHTRANRTNVIAWLRKPC